MGCIEVLGGTAELEDTIEQDFGGTAPRSHEQVYAADGLTKTGAQVCPQLADKQDEQGGCGHGQEHQEHRQPP